MPGGDNGGVARLPFGIDGLHPRAWNTYRFRTRWLLAADPDVLFGVLADVAGYGDWWPQVRDGVRTGDGAGDLVIRSTLPYDLRVHLEQRRRDPAARILEARLTGDIDGVAAWRIEPVAADPPACAPPRCAAYFAEDVQARAALLRRLAPIARPAFIANHAAMMRDGQRGLARFLAGPDPAAGAPA